jgi:hypothetical protein
MIKDSHDERSSLRFEKYNKNILWQKEWMRQIKIDKGLSPQRRGSLLLKQPAGLCCYEHLGLPMAHGFDIDVAFLLSTPKVDCVWYKWHLGHHSDRRHCCTCARISPRCRFRDAVSPMQLCWWNVALVLWLQPLGICKGVDVTAWNGQILGLFWALQ